MSRLILDARLAVRGLVKRPGSGLVLVLTLAVGLAANAVIFNVFDAVVLRAFDFPNLPRLVRLWETHPHFDGIERGNVAPANLLDWREQGEGVFSDLVAWEQDHLDVLTRQYDQLREMYWEEARFWPF